MLKEQLQQMIKKLNQSLDVKSLNQILRPILMKGMRQGYRAAYLEIVSLTEEVLIENQSAEWIDSIEHLADQKFEKLVMQSPHVQQINGDLEKQIASMLSEEYHEVTAHNNNQLVMENVIMPYFNGWFLGYYYGMRQLIQATNAAQKKTETTLKQEITEQATQAVEIERAKFQRQQFYQRGVLADILSVLKK